LEVERLKDGSSVEVGEKTMGSSAGLLLEAINGQE